MSTPEGMAVSQVAAKTRLISANAAAERLGVVPLTVYRMMQRGELPSVRLGSRKLIPEGYIDQLIASATSATTGEA
ncbi:MAG: helix-turn-helix domain-containing protein [Spirochaetota bacterium]